MKSKVNNFIEEMMGKSFKAHVDKVLVYKKLNIQNFEQMCMFLGLEIRAYLSIDCKSDNKIVIKNNTVLDISYTPINIYELMFGVIFNYNYSNMINYKVIKDDGNFLLSIFEFMDSYYVLDYGTS